MEERGIGAYQSALQRYRDQIFREPGFLYVGLSPRMPMSLVSTLSTYQDSMKSCFKYGGGLYPYCTDLLLKGDSGKVFINSKEKFKEFYQPIDSEEEALSYVAIATNTELTYDFKLEEDFRFYVEELNQSYSQEVQGGYHVVTFRHLYFGCGPFTHYEFKHFVDYEGNIELIGKIDLYQNPDEDGTCID